MQTVIQYFSWLMSDDIFVNTPVYIFLNFHSLHWTYFKQLFLFS